MSKIESREVKTVSDSCGVKTVVESREVKTVSESCGVKTVALF